MVRGFFFVMLLLCCNPLSAQTIQPPGAPATAPYTDASGVTFPAAVGDFKRFRIHRAGGETVNAGYAYITAKERMVATVFVDRPPSSADPCRDMAGADRQVTKGRPGAILGELPAPAVAGYATAAFVSRADGPLGVSERYYFCRDGWVVQFNFQHAAAFDAAALEAAFLRGLPLPVPEKH